MTGGQWQMNLALRLSGRKLSPGNVTTVAVSTTDQTTQVMGYGTGDDQVNVIVLQDRTLGPGASEELDLYDGSSNSPPLVDIIGDAVALRKLRCWALWIASGGDELGVTVGGAGSDPNELWMGGTAPTYSVFPGGAPMAGGSDAGVEVTSSARYVKVLNNGAEAVTYTVAMAGSTVVSGAGMGVLGLTYP